MDHYIHTGRYSRIQIVQQRCDNIVFLSSRGKSEICDNQWTYSLSLGLICTYFHSNQIWAQIHYTKLIYPYSVDIYGL